MSRSYNLNTEHAKAAESFGKYLSESGKYVGQFSAAKAIKSTQGTEGIELSFKTDDGKEANYIQLWTYNAKSEELHGLRVLSALMTVLRIRGIQPTKVTEEGKQIDTFPQLVGKRIGVVFQREEYIKGDGSEGYKMLLVAPFDANSEMTAGEILSQAAAATALVGIVAYINSNPVRRQKNAKQQPRQESAQAGGAPMFDDDIPF